MFRGDSRAKWSPDRITDDRAVQWWDEGKIVGRWFGNHSVYREGGPILWDAYLLFGTEATWEEQLEPLVSWGRTVIGTREQLKRDIEKLLTPARRGPFPAVCISEGD